MEREIQNIEAYLAGTMQESEKQAFEQKIAADKELAEAVQDEKNSLRAIELYGRLQTREKVRNIYKNLSINEQGSKIIPFFQRTTFLAAAAVVLVLIISALVLSNTAQRYGNDVLSQEFAALTPIPDRLTLMGHDTVESLKAGMRAFNQENWQEAEQYFENLSDTSTYYPDAQLYLGLSLFQQNKWQETISVFENLQMKEPTYQEIINWYLAVSYLSLDQEQESRDYLNRITRSNEPVFMKESAQTLLEKLDHSLRSLL